jgi:hypothetical protein
MMAKKVLATCYLVIIRQQNLPMKFATTVIALLVFATVFSQEKPKKTVKETLSEIPDMLIAQPGAVADTNANKLMNDKMYIIIPPVWREVGTLSIIDFKLPKTDQDPVKATLPLPEKSIVKSMSINIGSWKKTAEEKRQQVLATQKSHLLALLKQNGRSMSVTELTEQLNNMQLPSEELTLNSGKKATLHYFQDFEAKQTSFIVLMLLPDAEKGLTYSTQFNYIKYNYETELPEDLMDLKVFVYPDEQQLFIDFTKERLKTFNLLQ